MQWRTVARPAYCSWRRACGLGRCHERTEMSAEKLGWFAYWRYWLWCKWNHVCFRHLCDKRGSSYQGYYCEKCNEERPDYAAIDRARRDAVIRRIRLGRGDGSR